MLMILYQIKTMTLEILKKDLNYNKKTGVFTWRTAPANRIIVGQLAGTLRKDGYRVICVKSKYYLAHRLAWFWIHMEWPHGDIDHINRVRSDNRIANLRDVSRSINMQNIKNHQKNNISGFLGATTMPHKRWHARIMVNGKQIFIGSFKSPLEAHNAYIKKKQEKHRGYVK